MMMDTVTTELDEAIAAWQKLADDEKQRIASGFYKDGSIETARYNVDTYERTVKSLEIQKSTGVAACTCCHKPLDGSCLKSQRQANNG